MEVLYKLKPMHLIIKEIAMKSLPRVTQNRDWSRIALTNHKGHLNKTFQWFGDRNCKFDLDITAKTRLWLDIKVEIGEGKDIKGEKVDWKCYTDGSVLDKKAGAGVMIYYKGEPHITLTTGLGEATIFQAEMYAILMAVQYLTKRASQEENKIILVDSQAVLLSLRHSESNTRSQLVVMEELAKVRNLEFRWIRAHQGHEGNELADVAAKKGTSSKVQVGQPKALSKFKSEVDHKIYIEWQKEWDRLPGHRQSKIFCEGPKDKRVEDLKSLGRFRTGTLIRFLSGHAFTNRHNYLMGLSDEVNCRLCRQQTEETPEHLIKECPILNEWRFEVFGTLMVFDDRLISYDQISTFISHYKIQDLEQND